MSDRAFLQRALRLAEKGLYTTDPNPRVGCVLVHNHRIIGEGYHQVAGQAHAEINALRDAEQRGFSTAGSTAYVTLEPCHHQGKTPPCTQALMNAQVSRVVVASLDPNPQATGGMDYLRSQGIAAELIDDELIRQQAEQLNAGFFQRLRIGRPKVTLKLAMSLDGRIALASGESQWITGQAAREDAQKLRAQMSAIITGSGTVLVDDPRYTVRPSTTLGEQPRQPLRVVVDNRARLHPGLQLFHTGSPVILITPDHLAVAHRETFRESQLPGHLPVVQVHSAPTIDGEHADLAAVVRYLAAEQQCNDLLVEAGAKLSGAFICAGLVDELVIYQAPTLLGNTAKAGVYLDVSQLTEQYRLTIIDQRRIGVDNKIIARLGAQ